LHYSLIIKQWGMPFCYLYIFFQNLWNKPYIKD
jgi:hypothetical protein